MTQIAVPVVSVVALAIGFWVVLDGNRLAKHVAVAERFMAEGMSEPDAVEQSGCNFWERPWYQRMTTSYPCLKS